MPSRSTPTPPDVSPIRAAIVGTGLIARVGHLPAIRATNGDVELVAAADVNETALDDFAADAQVPATYADPSKMLAAERPDTSGDSGRTALDLITALYKSAATGQTVQRGEIDSADPYYYSLDGGGDAAAADSWR